MQQLFETKGDWIGEKDQTQEEKREIVKKK